jgi:hypothetical protein
MAINVYSHVNILNYGLDGYDIIFGDDYWTNSNTFNLISPGVNSWVACHFAILGIPKLYEIKDTTEKSMYINKTKHKHYYVIPETNEIKTFIDKVSKKYGMKIIHGKIPKNTLSLNKIKTLNTFNDSNQLVHLYLGEIAERNIYLYFYPIPPDDVNWRDESYIKFCLNRHQYFPKKNMINDFINSKLFKYFDTSLDTRVYFVKDKLNENTFYPRFSVQSIDFHLNHKNIIQKSTLNAYELINVYKQLMYEKYGSILPSEIWDYIANIIIEYNRPILFRYVEEKSKEFFSSS